jgi:hypothetical protein
VAQELRGGSLALDTRPPELFAAFHVRESIQISLPGNFASWAATALIVAGELLDLPRVNAQNNPDSRIERGFQIAPVPLNLDGKDRNLVGLSSYLHA